jgi:hypothetical protein
MDRERPPDNTTRVQITRAVFDGLESIRRSGATNMLDRPVVLHLAREWDFTATADWIERVDTGTYGRLILQGPEVVEDDRADQQIENDLDNQDIEITPSEDVDEDDVIDVTEMAIDRVRGTMQDLLANLGKHAILTIADTYETQRMGVMVNPSRNNLITTERNALIRNLGQASSLWLQLDEAMTEAERGIGSLQYLIDPENN